MKSLSVKLRVTLICIWLLISYGYSIAEDSVYWSPVKIGEKCGFKDKTEKTVIKAQFDECNNFFDGLALVKIKGKWGFINETGKIVIPAKFDEAMTFFSEALASVKIGDKWGFINKKGDIVIDPKFSPSVSVLDWGGPYFRFGRAEIEVNGRFEYIDVSGEIISRDWWYCCQSEDETCFVYYNQKSMSYPSKNIVRIWSKWVKPGEGYDMLFIEIDCSNKTNKFLSTTSYNKKEAVSGGYSLSSEKSELDYIVPNSLMDGLADMVCRQKSK